MVRSALLAEQAVARRESQHVAAGRAERGGSRQRRSVGEVHRSGSGNLAPGRGQGGGWIRQPVIGRTAGQVGRCRQGDALVRAGADAGRLVRRRILAHVGIDAQVQVGPVLLREHGDHVGVDRRIPGSVGHRRRHARPVANVAVTQYARGPYQPRARHQDQQDQRAGLSRVPPMPPRHDAEQKQR